MSNEPNKPDRIPGTFVWNEVLTRNKPASIEFYSKLFGWTTEEMEMPDGSAYIIFKKGDQAVASCCSLPDDAAGAPQMWMSYIHVDDVDASVARATELGATICREKVDLPMGSFAVVTDPNGATFAFWKPSGDCSS